MRLPLLSPYFLHDCVESQPVVRQSPECRLLVEEAKMFHLLPDRRAELQSPRTKHRNSAGTIQVFLFLTFFSHHTPREIFLLKFVCPKLLCLIQIIHNYI